MKDSDSITDLTQAARALCTDIRKTELFRNLKAIQMAAKSGFDDLQARVPRLEFTENPARFFTLRDPAPWGVTVNVSMELDGKRLSIETILHTLVNGLRPTAINTVGVETRRGSVYYVYDGREVSIPRIANIILRPLRDSFQRGVTCLGSG